MIAEVALRLRIALPRRYLIPLRSLLEIARNPTSIAIQIAQVALRGRVAQRRGFRAYQPSGFGQILRTPLPCSYNNREMMLHLSISLFGRYAIPLHRLRPGLV